MASRKRIKTIEEKKIDKRWEITGIAIAAFGVMLLLALLSYDRNDFSAKTASTETANWIGIFGAYLAKGFFWLFGFGAFLIPLTFISWGLSIPISALRYLQKRWPWMFLLAITICCGLDIYENLFPKSFIEKISATSPGGIVGYLLYNYVFFIFGKVGATTVLITFYLISIISLTNVKLDEWIAIITAKLQQMKENAIQRHKEAEARHKAEEARRKEAEREKRLLLLEAKKEAEEKERQEAEAARQAKEAEAQAEEQLNVDEDSEEYIEANEDLSEDKTKELPESTEEKPVNYKIIDAYSPEKINQQKSSTEIPSPRMVGDYKLPPVDLMQQVKSPAPQLDAESEMIANAECIRQTLAEFKLEVKPGPITRGPTVTMYEFLPAKGIKMSRFTAMNDNLAAALKAISINILAPIPGKNSIGIEVPNREKVKVVMRELLESPEWQNSKARIPIALGKNIYGKTIIADLADMPHLLVAGSTGSGKSVCINAIVASLLYKFSPEELRFVMVDPKVVELQQYNHLPHMIVPVVTDPKKVVLTLQWVVNEMEKRYKIFAQVGVRNIRSFNSRPIKSAEELAKEAAEKAAAENNQEGQSTEGVAVELDKEISVPRDEELVIPDKLSYIVLIIDELADLMVVAGKDVETLITRITQMARAAGIHCIVATQRPSVDIITGVIKSNIPCRIAFQVASAIDSRTILDGMGAEKLLGKGDMLFLPPGTARTIRVQGALITDEEIEAIIHFISEQAKPNFFEDFLKQLSQPTDSGSEGEDDEDEDLIQDCIDVILTRKRASVSILQRELRLGYNRAARLMEILERRHIVGPSRGSRDREILMLRNE